MRDIVRVGRVSELKEASAVRFQHGGVPYFAVRAEGEIKAYISLCSHEDKVFDPQLEGGCVVCPFHKVYFDAGSGDVKDSNGKRVPRGLPKVETEVRDGWLFVFTEDAHRTLLAESEARRSERRARKQRRRRWLDLLNLRLK